MKITHHRVIEDEYIWEGISLTNTCCVIQSVFYQVLNALRYGVFKSKCLMEK